MPFLLSNAIVAVAGAKAVTRVYDIATALKYYRLQYEEAKKKGIIHEPPAPKAGKVGGVIRLLERVLPNGIDESEKSGRN